MLRTLSLCAALALVTQIALAQPPGGPGGGGGLGRGMFGRGGGAMGELFLLRIPEVAAELELTDAQKEATQKVLEELGAQMRARGPGFFQELQNLSQDEQKKKLEELAKEGEETAKKAHETLAKSLDPKQMQRLAELAIQQQGARALTCADVAEKLALTAEQKDKMKSIFEAVQAASPFTPGQQPTREEFQKFREAGEKAQQEILALLTPEQKTKFDELKGKEFKFPEFGRGGPGGPGGGRRNRDGQ